MGARARIIVASLCAAFAGSEAVAQSNPTPVAYYNGSPSQATLSIPVTASVAAPCGFVTAPDGSHDEPDFDDHAWQVDFPFVIDCNVASRVAVVSANGGLKTPGSVPAGYTTLAPYDVSLNVVQNSGTATGSCAVANLISGGSCPFVGPAAVGQGLAVAVSQNQPGSYVRVSAPAYAGADVLIASEDYVDTLIVTLSPDI